MIPKILTRNALKFLNPQYNTLNLSVSYNFVIMKMIKKKLRQQQHKQQTKPQTKSNTYSYNEAETKKKSQAQAEDEDEDYDFFARQKQMDINKDFRKMKLQSEIIPRDIGKGGFDEVVYWSRSAKTPEQIMDIIKVFNRVQVPQKVVDVIAFQEFGAKALEAVYLASSMNALKEYTNFGFRFSIQDSIFWMKIQQKVTRLNPSTPDQIKDCIDIAFIMSRTQKGEILFSNLQTIFKNSKFDTQDTAKILISYYNFESGDKHWIKTLFQKIIAQLDQVNPKLLSQLLIVFKQLKYLSSQDEQKVYAKIQQHINEMSFRDLSIASGFIGHGKVNEKVWNKIEKRAQQVLKNKEINTQRSLVLLLQMLSAYSLSPDFVKSHLLQALRKDNYALISKCYPEVLSFASKIMYIYELEQETHDIQQTIESFLMKKFNDLKQVQTASLIKVIKDYTVTRIGSRQLYIFLQEVVLALFDEIKKDQKDLQMLYTVYQKSNLCTPALIQKIELYLL